jgi:PAS domain S-box-containing protein
LDDRQRHREVLAINRAIAGARDHDEILRLVVGRSAAITGCSVGLLLLEGADGLARVACAVGVDQAKAAAIALPLSERVDAELCRLLDLQPVDGFVGVPVIGEAGLKGVLAVYYRSRQGADLGADEAMLSAFADQAAIALEGAERLRRLRDSERRFRTLADEAPVGIFQTDGDGRNVYLNRMGQELAGLTQLAALSTYWHHSVHPEDRERVIAEWRLAAAAGRASSSVYRVQGPDGGTALVRSHAKALRDEGDRLTGYIGVTIDVTETQSLRAHVALAARLAAIGSLVVESGMGGSAAGLLSLHQQALSEARAVQARLQGDGPIDRRAEARALDALVEVLTRAQAGGGRIAGLVKDVSASAETGVARMPVRFFDVVSHAIHWLPASVLERAAIQIEEVDEREIRASAFQIEQVVVNLVCNATRAARSGEKSRIAITLENGSRGMARMEITDRGTGIDPASLERLFEQPAGVAAAGGAGLGLALSHAIVTAHGGTLTVVSAPGRGSTFRVELPSGGSRTTPEPMIAR